MNHRTLRLAIAAGLFGQTEPHQGRVGELPANVAPDLTGSPADLRGGEARTLAGLTVQGVPPGHEYEPAPKRFQVVGSVCYVRAVDYPALKQALERRRAGACPQS